ncbi:MAG: hypothetical protein WD851_22345, partial [Pirellulales bacterium]
QPSRSSPRKRHLFNGLLDEERARKDFSTLVKEFRKYLTKTGGPMADSTFMRDTSFIERRVFDKLIFCEGEWLGRFAKTDEEDATVPL